MLLWAIALATVVLSIPYRVSAQPATNATCPASYTWASNSLQQSPCLVAAYLGSACNDGVFLVPQLGLNDHYLGPTSENANPCQCSSVFYSLISACADCSGHIYLSWSTWDTNCAIIYLSTFPDDIPLGTAVPAWAYLNISTVDGYDSIRAQQDLASPESTRIPQPTGSVSSLATPSTTLRPSPTRKLKTGALAGAIAGGLVVVSAVAGLGFFIRRHNRHAARRRSRFHRRSQGALPFEISEYPDIYTGLRENSPTPLASGGVMYEHPNMSQQSSILIISRSTPPPPPMPELHVEVGEDSRSVSSHREISPISLPSALYAASEDASMPTPIESSDLENMTQSTHLETFRPNYGVNLWSGRGGHYSRVAELPKFEQRM